MQPWIRQTDFNDHEHNNHQQLLKCLQENMRLQFKSPFIYHIR